VNYCEALTAGSDTLAGRQCYSIKMSIWVLVMLALHPGVPRDVTEGNAIYVAVFDTYAKCTSQANASNNSQDSTQKTKTYFECKEERVH
jgi:hypothetical protein